MISAEVVLVAIQAAVRLYSGLRNAYVTSVRDATLTLPLPRAPGQSMADIVNWFQGQAKPQHRPVPGSWLADLINKFPNFTPAEQETLRQAYAVCYAEENGPTVDAKGGVLVPTAPVPVSAADFLAFTEVQQWAKDQPGAPRSGFQLVAGTLIDVAVFWFANKPGAVSTDHPEGRALLAFLKGVEKVDFANTAPPELLGQVLVGVLDTVAAEPRLVVGGRKEETLVTNVAKALATALDQRFKKPRTDDEANDAASWAQLVARALLKAGADTVLANPKLFLGVKDGDASAVVQEVGATFLDLLFPDDPQDQGQIALRSLVSGTGLEALVRAALKAVGEHPGVLALGQKRQGLTALIADLATTFADAKLPPSAAAAFSDIVQTVLEKSAEHLDSVWGGDKKDVERNLLVIATRQVLAALAAAAKGGGPVFTTAQTIALFDAVLAEIIENPGWVEAHVSEIGDSSVLSAALEAVLTSLRGQSLGALSGETAVAILKAALKAGGLQLALLHEIPPGGRDAGKIAVEAVIDAVFIELTKGDANAKWRVARGSALVVLFEISLNAAAKAAASDAKTQACVDVVRVVVALYVQSGMSLDEFGRQLADRLKAIA